MKPICKILRGILINDMYFKVRGELITFRIHDRISESTFAPISHLITRSTDRIKEELWELK